MASTARNSRLQPADERRDARHQLRLKASCVEFGGVHYSATIREISASGVLVECSAPLTSGDDIVVDAWADEPLCAKVIWTDGNLFGCEFAKFVSKSAISAAVLRNESTTPRKDMGELSPNGVVEGQRTVLSLRVLAVVVLGLLAWVPLALALRAFLD